MARINIFGTPTNPAASGSSTWSICSSGSAVAGAGGLAVAFRAMVGSASLTRPRLQFILVLYVVANVNHDFILFSDSRPLVVNGCYSLVLCIISYF
jgi:L-aminopeptidase/D-esterase-like protein